MEPKQRFFNFKFPLTLPKSDIVCSKLVSNGLNILR